MFVGSNIIVGILMSAISTLVWLDCYQHLRALNSAGTALRTFIKSFSCLNTGFLIYFNFIPMENGSSEGSFF